MITLVPVADAEKETARLLLEESKLPTDILSSSQGELWIARESGATAVGGFEFYGDDALLRSVAVDASRRSAGFGRRLVEQLIEVAVQRNVQRVWLLTETAEGFFQKMGFIRVERQAITNRDLLGSPEFTHVCAQTAVCMVKRVKPKEESTT